MDPTVHMCRKVGHYRPYLSPSLHGQTKTGAGQQHPGCRKTLTDELTKGEISSRTISQSVKYLLLNYLSQVYTMSNTEEQLDDLHKSMLNLCAGDITVKNTKQQLCPHTSKHLNTTINPQTLEYNRQLQGVPQTMYIRSPIHHLSSSKH